MPRSQVLLPGEEGENLRAGLGVKTAEAADQPGCVHRPDVTDHLVGRHHRARAGLLGLGSPGWVEELLREILNVVHSARRLLKTVQIPGGK